MLNNRGALKPHQRERTKYGGYYSILQVTTKFCTIRVFWRVLGRIKRNKTWLDHVKTMVNHIWEVVMIASQILSCQKVSGLLDFINI